MSERSDVTTLAQGAGISLIGKTIGRAAQILGQIVAARILGPDNFGLYAIGLTLLQIVGLSSQLGLSQGVVYFGSQWRGKDEERLAGIVGQAITIALLTGFLTGIGLFVAAPWLASQVFHDAGLLPVLRLLSPALALFAGLYVSAAATTISQQLHYLVLSQELAQTISGLALLVLVLSLGWGVRGAVAAQVASYLLALLLGLHFVKQVFPGAFSGRAVPTRFAVDMIVFSLPIALIGVFNSLMVWVDRLVIGALRSTSEVGVYQSASQVSLIFVVILSAFNAVFAPMIADLYSNRHLARVESLFQVTTKWALYLSIPVFLVVVFAPREFLTVVFGSDYAAGATPLVILSIGQLINAATGSVGFILIMTGQQMRWMMLSGLYLVLNVGLSVILVPQLGPAGAALATATATSGLYITGLVQVKRRLGLWPYARRYLKGLVASLLSASTLLLVNQIGIESDLLALAIAAVVAGSTFVGALLVLGLDTEDHEIFRVLQLRIGRCRAGHSEN